MATYVNLCKFSSQLGGFAPWGFPLASSLPTPLIEVNDTFKSWRLGYLTNINKIISLQSSTPCRPDSDPFKYATKWKGVLVKNFVKEDTHRYLVKNILKINPYAPIGWIDKIDETCKISIVRPNVYLYFLWKPISFLITNRGAPTYRNLPMYSLIYYHYPRCVMIGWNRSANHSNTQKDHNVQSKVTLEEGYDDRLEKFEGILSFKTLILK